jgi:hypothetical protein
MSLNGTAWTPIGPNPIQEGGNPDNGMVTAIAINPNNKNVIYIGTAGGGVTVPRDSCGKIDRRQADRRTETSYDRRRGDWSRRWHQD